MRIRHRDKTAQRTLPPVPDTGLAGPEAIRIRIFQNITRWPNFKASKFWSSILITDDCWEWTGPTCKGYGYFNGCIGKKWIASRLMWTLIFGDIPEGLWVLHQCDNPICVRPLHLFLGTNSDNCQDSIAKGRWSINRPRGEEKTIAKLSEYQVVQIRKLLKQAVYQYVIAAKFGICQQQVSRIHTRKHWRHV